jgi:hypothetical protein
MGQILAKNRLDSDFINQRLNGGSRPPIQRRGAAASAADDDDNTITPGFLAALLVLCLAVGGGTFYFAGSGGTLSDIMNGTTGPFTSTADGACKKMWVDNVRNSPALNCYLTTNVARLCDAREKKHLAQIIRSYRNDQMAYTAKMTLGGLQAGMMMQSSESMNNLRTISQSTARQSVDQNYELSQEEKDAFDSHGKLLQRMEKAAEVSGWGAINDMKQFSEEELAKKIRRIGASGYMSKDDFGWFPDVLVSAAFQNVKATGSPCKS